MGIVSGKAGKSSKAPIRSLSSRDDSDPPNIMRNHTTPLDMIVIEGMNRRNLNSAGV